MEKSIAQTGVGGWRAPCLPFDYEKMEREAASECAAIHDRLERLKRWKAPDAERELIRRREVRILTDMYYEQRGNALMLAEKKKERAHRMRPLTE